MSSRKFHFKLILILISSVLISVWFRKHLMMGYAENGLPFYNPGRLFQTASYAWSEVILGLQTPSVYASSLFYIFLSFFEVKLGVQPWVMQCATYCLFLVVSGLSVFSLTLMLVRNSGLSENLRHSAAVISGLFYILNPFSMTLVWHRFLLTFIFFYTLLPLSMLLAIKGLEEKKYIYGILLVLASTAMAYGFAEPPFIGTFWLVLLTYFLYHILTNIHNRQNMFFGLKFTFLTLTLWVLLNAWWLLAFISGAPRVLETQTSESGNLAVLLGISQQDGQLIYVSRLIDYYYTYIETDWGNIFSSPLFEIIPTIIPIATFSTMFLRKKSKLLKYFILLTLLLLFLTKGAAPPFGQAFVWLFIHVPIFQVFRDPVEKFGIALPLGYSPLFGIGLVYLYSWITKKFRIEYVSNGKSLDLRKPLSLALVSIILFSTMGVYVWPMWTGMVFTSPCPPANNPQIGYYVEVPAYYQEANSWLNQQNQSFRLMVLPLDGFGINYNWTYGYCGSELSFELFDKPAVSMPTGIAYDDAIITGSEQLLLTSTQFWKLLAILNVKYVVIRNDVDYQARDMLAPSTITRALNYSVSLPSLVDGQVNTSSPNVIDLDNSYNATRWQLVWAWKPYDFHVTYNDTRQSNYAMELISRGPYCGFWYFPTYTNWTNAQYLEVWMKTNISTTALIQIQDQNGNIISLYEPINTTNTWTLLTISLASISPRQLNFSSINRLLFGIKYPANISANFEVSGIFLDYGFNVHMEHIHYVKTIGELDFYALDNDYFLPRVYAVGNFTFAKNVNDMLFNLIPSSDFDPRNTIIFLQSQSNINNVSLLQGLESKHLVKPMISFEKIDPTKYIVKIENATTPFFLVLSETYSPSWEAYYGDIGWFNAFFSHPISKENHFIVNGYANGWYINRTGSYTITLYFKPQSKIVLGIYISYVTLTALIVILIYINRLKIRKLLLLNRRPI